MKTASRVTLRSEQPVRTLSIEASLIPAVRNRSLREVQMPRSVGERYECKDCGAVLVYENACPCPPGMEHSEVCCGKPMTQVQGT